MRSVLRILAGIFCLVVSYSYPTQSLSAQNSAEAIYAVSFRAGDTVQVAVLYDDATWQVHPVDAPIAFGDIGRGYVPIFLPQWAGTLLVGTGTSIDASDINRSYDYLYGYDSLTHTSQLLSEKPLSAYFEDVVQPAIFRVASISPDGRYVFVTDDSHNLIFDLTTHEHLAFTSPLLEVKAWRGDKVLVSSFTSDIIQTIDIPTGEMGVNIVEVYAQAEAVNDADLLGWYFADFISDTQILIYDLNNQQRGVWVFDLTTDEIQLIEQDAYAPLFSPNQEYVAFWIDTASIGVLNVDDLTFTELEIPHIAEATINLVDMQWVTEDELIFWNVLVGEDDSQSAQIGRITRSDAWSLNINTVFTRDETVRWFPLKGDTKFGVLVFANLGAPEGEFHIYSETGELTWISQYEFPNETVDVVRFADAYFNITQDYDWFFINHRTPDTVQRTAIRWTTGDQFELPFHSYFVASTPDHAWLLFEQCTNWNENEAVCEPDRLLAIHGATGQEVVLVDGLALHNLISFTDSYNRYVETALTQK